MIKLPENPTTAFNLYCFVNYLQELEEQNGALHVVENEMKCLSDQARFLGQYSENPNPAVRETFDQIDEITQNAIQKLVVKRDLVTDTLREHEQKLEACSQELLLAGVPIRDKCFSIPMEYVSDEKKRVIKAFVKNRAEESKLLNYEVQEDRVVVSFPGTREAKNEAFEILKMVNDAGFFVALDRMSAMHDIRVNLGDLLAGNDFYSVFCARMFAGLDCFDRNYRAFESLDNDFNPEKLCNYRQVEEALRNDFLANNAAEFEEQYQKNNPEHAKNNHEGERRYVLAVVNSQTGERKVMPNLKHMSHHEACTMKSKFTHYPGRHIELEELNPEQIKSWPALASKTDMRPG